MKQLIIAKNNMSQKSNIKLVKNKKLKLREKLRALRKLNIYYTLFPRYTKFQLDPWFRNKKPKKLTIGSFHIVTKIFSRGKYPTYMPKLTIRSKLWGISLNKSLKLLTGSDITPYSYNTLSLINQISYDIGYLKFLICTKLPKQSNTIHRPAVSVQNILVLNNKRTQFYLTLLSKSVWGWKTDVSLYPGILAILFGARNKHQRSMYKKKDKTILKSMTKAFQVGLPRYINKFDPIALIVRGKPRSSEYYDHFLQLMFAMFRSSILFVILKPGIRHTFKKLRKYARVKRRLRKTITKRTADLHNTSIIKEAECDLVTEEYLTRVIR